MSPACGGGGGLKVGLLREFEAGLELEDAEAARTFWITAAFCDIAGDGAGAEVEGRATAVVPDCVLAPLAPPLIRFKAC